MLQISPHSLREFVSVSSRIASAAIRTAGIVIYFLLPPCPGFKVVWIELVGKAGKKKKNKKIRTINISDVNLCSHLLSLCCSPKEL